MNRPRLLIISPTLADANTGNWHTAARWQQMLEAVVDVQVADRWGGEPVDALITLHARKSAAAVTGFQAAYPDRAIALVLTGTDVYRDIALPGEEGEVARHATKCASHLVVLQADALDRLDPAEREKSRVIVQSAKRLRLERLSREGTVELVAVGHLRSEKDPATLMEAMQLLPADSPVRLTQIGDALDPELGRQAERTAAAASSYRWLGGMDRDAARRHMATADALVHTSIMEGGAQVVIEAIRSGTPVLASRIGGNMGLLGADYRGYFPVGNAAALAALMQRFASDPAFADQLRTQCAQRDTLFTPYAERSQLRRLVRDLLQTSK